MCAGWQQNRNVGEMEVGVEATILVQRQQDHGLKRVPCEFSDSELLTMFEQILPTLLSLWLLFSQGFV